MDRNADSVTDVELFGLPIHFDVPFTFNSLKNRVARVLCS